MQWKVKFIFCHRYWVLDKSVSTHFNWPVTVHMTYAMEKGFAPLKNGKFQHDSKMHLMVFLKVLTEILGRGASCFVLNSILHGDKRYFETAWKLAIYVQSSRFCPQHWCLKLMKSGFARAKVPCLKNLDVLSARIDVQKWMDDTLNDTKENVWPEAKSGLQICLVTRSIWT
jgi:hypothetical protein